MSGTRGLKVLSEVLDYMIEFNLETISYERLFDTEGKENNAIRIKHKAIGEEEEKIRFQIINEDEEKKAELEKDKVAKPN